MAHRATLGERLADHNVSRRQFLKFCGVMAAALALPQPYADQIARALAMAPRLPILWLEFQGCTGDTESFLRAAPQTDAAQRGVTDPGIVSLLLEVLSVDYLETIMAPAGDQAARSYQAARQQTGQYVCVVEGAIPTAQNGHYCVIGGRTALSIVQEASAGALATIALGACATDGGISAAAPNPTGALGVSGAAPHAPNLMALPGCPANVVNLVASLVYYLTFKRWPDCDSAGRPLFAYGSIVHDQCERRLHYENKEFVTAWGDDHHRQGWCLFNMGCRGPYTLSNCPTVKWNEGTNWPVGGGHSCVGCTMPHFWDNPFPKPIYP